MRGDWARKFKRPIGMTDLKKYGPIGHFWRSIDGVDRPLSVDDLGARKSNARCTSQVGNRWDHKGARQPILPLDASVSMSSQDGPTRRRRAAPRNRQGGQQADQVASDHIDRAAADGKSAL